MNILSTVNPFTKYLYAGAAIALAAGLAFTHLTVYRAGRHAVQAEWDADNVKRERASQEQATRNRELQRLAEAHFHAIAGPQVRYITRIAKEAQDAAAPLAACPVPAGAVRLLNAAAACARGDSPAACGAGDGVPAAR